MVVDQVVPRVRNLGVNFVDDDELQAALARSRKAKLHKAKKISPEEYARKSEYYIYVCLCGHDAPFSCFGTCK